MRAIKIIMTAFAAILSAAFLCGCEKDDIAPEELVGGYWLQIGEVPEQSTPLMLNFEATGHVFNYLFRYDSSENIYHISLDTSWGKNDKYLIDGDNAMLFIAPDWWFTILRLTPSEMSLREGEAMLDFKKLSAKDVKKLPPEEFRSASQNK